MYFLSGDDNSLLTKLTNELCRGDAGEVAAVLCELEDELSTTNYNSLLLRSWRYCKITSAMSAV